MNQLMNDRFFLFIDQFHNSFHLSKNHLIVLFSCSDSFNFQIFTGMLTISFHFQILHSLQQVIRLSNSSVPHFDLGITWSTSNDTSLPFFQQYWHLKLSLCNTWNLFLAGIILFSNKDKNLSKKKEQIKATVRCFEVGIGNRKTLVPHTNHSQFYLLFTVSRYLSPHLS